MATFETQLKQGKNAYVGIPDWQKPKNIPKFVDKYSQNASKIASKIPAAFGASTLGMNNNNQFVQQQRAANPSGVGQPGMVKKHISQEEQQVINPQAQMETAETYTDGTSGIDDMSKAATAGLQEQLRQQQAAAQSNAANSGGMGGIQYDGAGGILGMDGLDAEQIGYANQIIKMGMDRGLGADDIQTALMTAMTESSLRNLGHGDNVGPDSRGLFQQRFTQGWGTEQQIMDPNYSIGKFYDTLANTSRGPNIWNTAQNVQRSAFSDGSNYQKNAGAASSLWNAYNQNGGISTAPVQQANGAASWINANNGKYHDYDGAYGAQCVDLYAFYTSGFAGGQPFGVGYAQELWGNHDKNAYAMVGGNQTPQMGDVAIWSNGFNGMGGHVAIVAQDNGNGTIRTLSANSTSLGPKGNTVMINLSKGSLLGYLRPRKLM